MNVSFSNYDVDEVMKGFGNPDNEDALFSAVIMPGDVPPPPGFGVLDSSPMKSPSETLVLDSEIKLRE